MDEINGDVLSKGNKAEYNVDVSGQEKVETGPADEFMIVMLNDICFGVEALQFYIILFQTNHHWPGVFPTTLASTSSFTRCGYVAKRCD